jgi:hypothetical protein
MLQRLETLRRGTTMCPGRLSRDCGSTLAQARADLLGLAHAGKVVLSQRGEPAQAADLKGPFRVRLR